MAQTFGKLVEERLKALNLNAFAVEKLANLPPDAIRNVMRSEKKSGPTLSRVEEICRALDLDFYIGPKRETGPVQHTLINGDDFAAIPRLDAVLSAGNGSENGHPQVIETLAFRRDWLQRIGISPTGAVLVSVKGDSMAPQLQDGDLALIDTSRTRVKSGLVYALTDQGQTRVKRVDVLPDKGLILRSDNPAYPVEPRLGEEANRVQIVGQVVWSGHVWR